MKGKVVGSIREAVALAGLKDGMTVSFHHHLRNGDYVLNLVMETLCIVCTVDPAFTASVENKICPFTIAIFLKYSNGTCSGHTVRHGWFC